MSANTTAMAPYFTDLSRNTYEQELLAERNPDEIRSAAFPSRFCPE
jgi:hypothetical protein